jgi:YegS/Rv2252/BmrU family lipid kinase
VIWNRNAGTKAGMTVTEGGRAEIETALDRAGIRAEIVEASDPDAAAAAAADALHAGCDLLVAAGGDGTVAAIGGRLLGRDAALGILPLGSVMNVARSVGIPRDLSGATSILGTGVVRQVDVGEVAGRPFFEGASVGMNAAMFREAERFDDGDWFSVLRTIWVAFRYRPARMRIHLDDRVIQTRALRVTVANGPYAGLGMTVAPAARLDDGRFDVRVFRRFSKIRLLRHLVSIAFGRVRYAPEVDTYRSRTVRIESARPLPARADNHDLGTTPVEFRLRSGALRIVAPADRGSM